MIISASTAKRICLKKKVHEEFIKKTYSKLSRTPKDVN